MSLQQLGFLLGVTSQPPPEGPPSGADCFRVCGVCEKVVLSAGKSARIRCVCVCVCVPVGMSAEHFFKAFLHFLSTKAETTSGRQAEQSGLVRMHAMLSTAQAQANDLLAQYNRLVATYRCVCVCVCVCV